MRKKIVAGNWKMNKNLSEGVVLANELVEKIGALSTDVEVILGVPFTHLEKVASISDMFSVSAQNCSAHISGAYTGEISTKMIVSTGAKYVILGHSERRAYHAENNSDLAKIGSMYNIPKDVLEAISKGSTYENQEKSTARHIQYSETPKAMDLLEGLCNLFSLNVEDYKLSFADNSFMKVFEKDQAEINKINAETLQTLTNNGAKASEVAEMLGINLNFIENAPQG